MGFGQYLDLIRLKHPAFVGQYQHLVATVGGTEEPMFTVEDEIVMMGVFEDVVGTLSKGEQA